MASLPPASQIPVRIGEVVLGKYVVERVIGNGSMGSLVAVRHQQLGDLDAVQGGASQTRTVRSSAAKGSARPCLSA